MVELIGFAYWVLLLGLSDFWLLGFGAWYVTLLYVAVLFRLLLMFLVVMDDNERCDCCGYVVLYAMVCVFCFSLIVCF